MDSTNSCNHGKIQSDDDMNFLKAGDSRDSLYFTNNIISHSFWNRGRTHVTACCTQCVLMKQISTCDTHDLTDQLRSKVHVVFRTDVVIVREVKESCFCNLFTGRFPIRKNNSGVPMINTIQGLWFRIVTRCR